MEKIKIGILYGSDPRYEYSGYSYAHAQGIEEMRRNIGLEEAQILVVYNVTDTAESKPGIESAMRDLIAQGVNIIIATSWGYMESCEKLAAEFPGIVFLNVSGSKYNNTNFTSYFGRIYEARYLSGIAAGLKTKTGKIGYVAAYGRGSSEVSGGINAFALGVERVNPGARIYVKITYNWFDPMGESEAARALIAEGCDIIAQHCDTSQPQIQAERSGVWGIGYNSDMRSEAPGAVLCCVVWHWGVCYTQLVQSVIDGTFTTAPWLGGLAEGIVGLTSLVPDLAAPETDKIIEAERQRIIQGGFNVFDGVLETADGRTIGREGAALSDNEIQNGINWYYRTVIELQEM